MVLMHSTIKEERGHHVCGCLLALHKVLLACLQDNLFGAVQQEQQSERNKQRKREGTLIGCGWIGCGCDFCLLACLQDNLFACLQGSILEFNGKSRR